MAVVRYVALATLVIWLGAMQGALVGDRTMSVNVLAYVCGGLLVVCLVAMKFLGPPPRAFVVRLAIVIVMLAVTTSARWLTSSMVPLAVNTALGFALLAWYARE